MNPCPLDLEYAFRSKEILIRLLGDTLICFVAARDLL